MNITRDQALERLQAHQSIRVWGRGKLYPVKVRHDEVYLIGVNKVQAVKDTPTEALATAEALAGEVTRYDF